MAYEKILKQTEHRNYPFPKGKWAGMQDWKNLLFLHYPVYPAFMEHLIPKELELDLFNEEAWISIVPFKVEKMRIRKLPPLPIFYSFSEVNVRTYVKKDGIPGVYFFSMDAANLFAVTGAKVAGLPYYHAKTKLRKRAKKYYFRSMRKSTEKETFKATYQPEGKLFYPEKGSIDYWLMERYALWTNKNDALIRGDIHHKPWKIQHADVSVEEQTLTSAYLPNNAFISEPVAHYGKSKRVLIWPVRKDE